MPTLKDYLGDRELLPAGNYDFTVTDAVLALADGKKKNPTVQVKGRIHRSDGSETGGVVFLYLHPNCRPMVAEQLLATGVLDDHEVDMDDGETVREACEALVGTTLRVRCKQRTYEGVTRAELAIKGVGDASAAGRV